MSDGCCKVCGNWIGPEYFPKHQYNYGVRTQGLWGQCQRMYGMYGDPDDETTLAFSGDEIGVTETHESFCCNMFKKRSQETK